MTPEPDKPVSFRRVFDVEEVKKVFHPSRKSSAVAQEEILKIVAESGAVMEATGTEEQLSRVEEETEGDLIRIPKRSQPAQTPKP